MMRLFYKYESEKVEIVFFFSEKSAVQKSVFIAILYCELVYIKKFNFSKIKMK